MKERVRPLLSNVGFSPLETDVYVALLKEPGASGYRVAQVVGKSVGSIYKALDSLRVKGAVVANESTRPTTYVALSIHEYMNARRRDLEVLETKIEQELEEVVAAPAQGGVFELNSVGQVYERCRDLLRSAQTVALLNIDARPLEELRGELIAAADRGVKVLIKTRAPARVPGCGILAPGRTQPGYVRSGDELGVAVDFREYVQAFLKIDGSGVEEAIWIRQPLLANHVCTLFQNDFTLTKVGVMVQAGKDVKAISREMRRLTRSLEVPAPPGLIPHEWTLTDAKRRARKRKAKERQPPRPTKVTVRQIEYILVASSRTVTVESAGIPDPNKPPPDSKELPAPDPDTLIEPLY